MFLMEDFGIHAAADSASEFRTLNSWSGRRARNGPKREESWKVIVI
jgi:hypothetical protein